jgi:hypothetical protein
MMACITGRASRNKSQVDSKPIPSQFHDENSERD